MEPKPLLAAALVVLSLGLSACGSGGSDSTSTETETAPAAGEAEAGETSSQSEEPGGSEPAPSGAARKSEKVQISESGYEPDPVVVQVGGKVIWQNEGSSPQTATADGGSFDTGTIDEGKLGSATFKEAGTFAYHSETDPAMHGTVEVVE